MKAKSYFLFSLLLPILIPLAVIPLAKVKNLASFLLYSLVFGGIPYAIFLVGANIWAARKDAKTIQRLTFIAPVIVAFILNLVLMRFLDAGIDRVWIFMIFEVTLGYAYVVIVNAVFYRLKAGHLIKE